MSRGSRKSLAEIGILTPEEAADLLGLSLLTIRRGLKDGTLKGNQPRGENSYWYIRREDAIAWLVGEQAA